jgi:hypothetical protein
LGDINTSFPAAGLGAAAKCNLYSFTGPEVNLWIKEVASFMWGGSPEAVSKLGRKHI